MVNAFMRGTHNAHTTQHFIRWMEGKVYTYSFKIGAVDVAAVAYSLYNVLPVPLSNTLARLGSEKCGIHVHCVNLLMYIHVVRVCDMNDNYCTLVSTQ